MARFEKSTRSFGNPRRERPRASCVSGSIFGEAAGAAVSLRGSAPSRELLVVTQRQAACDLDAVIAQRVDSSRVFGERRVFDGVSGGSAAASA